MAKKTRLKKMRNNMKYTLLENESKQIDDITVYGLNVMIKSNNYEYLCS